MYSFSEEVGSLVKLTSEEFANYCKFKDWYEEAMIESNKAGFTGFDAAETILYQAENIERLKGIISEIHSWIVCAAIASPEDMAQNFERICEITSPDYKGE